MPPKITKDTCLLVSVFFRRTCGLLQWKCHLWTIAAPAKIFSRDGKTYGLQSLSGMSFGCASKFYFCFIVMIEKNKGSRRKEVKGKKRQKESRRRKRGMEEEEECEEEWRRRNGGGEKGKRRGRGRRKEEEEEEETKEDDKKRIQIIPPTEANFSFPTRSFHHLHLGLLPPNGCSSSPHRFLLLSSCHTQTHP